MANSASIADGQVATAATSILDGALAPGRRVNITFNNVHASLAQTLIITVSRRGSSTQRRVRKEVQAVGDSVVITNFPIQSGDTLYATTTTAAAVDYDITEGSNGPLNIKSYDSNGAVKQVASGVVGNQTLTGTLTTQTGVRIPATSVAAAGSVQGDAAALSEGFNVVTAADATKGVLLPVAVAGMEVEVKNIDAANAILKIWPNTGAAINAVTANAAFSIAAKTSVVLRASSTTQWYSIPLLPS